MSGRGYRVRVGVRVGGGHGVYTYTCVAVYVGMHAWVCVGVRVLAWGSNSRLTQTPSHTRFLDIFDF